SVDPGLDALAEWTINWGDGSVSTAAGSATSATHVYQQSAAAYTISATATDEDGGPYSSNSITVQVNNVAPSVTITGITPDDGTAHEGDSFTLTADYVDGGLDTHTAVIHW